MLCRFFHRTAGWVFIIVGFVAVATGIHVYNVLHHFNTYTHWLHMTLGILTFGLMEATFQFLKYDTAEYRVPNKKPITLEEFHRRVQAGEALVILDDMVLDMTKF